MMPQLSVLDTWDDIEIDKCNNGIVFEEQGDMAQSSLLNKDGNVGIGTINGVIV